MTSQDRAGDSRLTLVGYAGEYAHPSMSPDASMTAYGGTMVDDNGYLEEGLEIVDRRGNRIASFAIGGVGYAVWSPDSTRLVAETSIRTAYLYKINKDGNDRRTVVPHKEIHVEYGYPSIKPVTWDKDSLMFVAIDVYGQLGCRIFNRDGDEIRSIRSTKGIIVKVVDWSSNSGSLLIHYGKEFRNDDMRTTCSLLEVYSVGNGDQIANKEFTDGEVLSARWAPDSASIAVLFRPRDWTIRLLLWNVRDGSVRVINDSKDKYAFTIDLHWSPDGRSIAATCPQYIRIYDVSPDGDGGKVIIDAHAQLARWSNNSARLMVAGCEKKHDISIGHNTVCTFDRNGDALGKITLESIVCEYSLSSDGLFLAGSGSGQAMFVAFLGKWSHVTNHLFSRDFRSLVIRMLKVRQRLDSHEAGIAHLPYLPMEIWLLIYGLMLK